MNKKQLYPFSSLIRFCLLFVAIWGLVSCSSDSEGIGGGSNKRASKLPGTLYWQFADKAGYQEFKGNKQDLDFMAVGSTFFFNAYDISWDNKYILVTVNHPDTWVNKHNRRIVVRDRSLIEGRLNRDKLNDDRNLVDFFLEWPDIGATVAHISPNRKYIAVDAQRYPDMPNLILDAEKEAEFRSWYVPGVDYNYYHTPVWTADNTLYFQIGNYLYKSGPEDDYGSAPRVLNLPEGASSATVNPQGTKVAFRYKTHIWMCDIDGENLTQVTTSPDVDDSTGKKMDGEFNPTFSPDGKYIAFLSRTARGWLHKDWWPSGEFTVVPYGGKYGYITIIPADGRLYGDGNNEKDVIFLLEKEEAGEDRYGVPADHWYPLRWR